MLVFRFAFLLLGLWSSFSLAHVGDIFKNRTKPILEHNVGRDFRGVQMIERDEVACSMQVLKEGEDDYKLVFKYTNEATLEVVEGETLAGDLLKKNWQISMFKATTGGRYSQACRLYGDCKMKYYTLFTSVRDKFNFFSIYHGSKRVADCYMDPQY